MKKISAALMAVFLCIGLLAGCGADYSANESTVFINSDGTVVSTDVEDFDTDTYKEKDLKKYVEDTIDEYNDKAGEKAVSLKELTVEKNKATLIIKYDSADHYKAFNGIELFNGTVAEVLAAGYTFDGDFASVKDGKATACDSSKFTKKEGYKVAVFAGSAKIKLDSDILFASVDDVSLVDERTIAIKSGSSLLTSAKNTDDTQAVEAATEDTEAVESADDGSVSEDELLDASTNEEKQFEFDDEEETTSTTRLIYVIYK